MSKNSNRRNAPRIGDKNNNSKRSGSRVNGRERDTRRNHDNNGDGYTNRNVLTGAGAMIEESSVIIIIRDYDHKPWRKMKDENKLEELRKEIKQVVALKVEEATATSHLHPTDIVEQGVYGKLAALAGVVRTLPLVDMSHITVKNRHVQVRMRISAIIPDRLRNMIVYEDPTQYLRVKQNSFLMIS
jgi:hypothetical protein